MSALIKFKKYYKKIVINITQLIWSAHCLIAIQVFLNASSDRSCISHAVTFFLILEMERDCGGFVMLCIVLAGSPSTDLWTLHSHHVHGRIPRGPRGPRQEHPRGRTLHDIPFQSSMSYKIYHCLFVQCMLMNFKACKVCLVTILCKVQLQWMMDFPCSLVNYYFYTVVILLVTHLKKVKYSEALKVVEKVTTCKWWILFSDKHIHDTHV